MFKVTKRKNLLVRHTGGPSKHFNCHPKSSAYFHKDPEDISYILYIVPKIPQSQFNDVDRLSDGSDDSRLNAVH